MQLVDTTIFKRDRENIKYYKRFAKDDMVCALEMFNEDYVTSPRDDIAKLSGLTMPVNKRDWRWDCPPLAVL